MRFSDNYYGQVATVAWRPDGKQVATGQWGLHLIALPAGKVTKLPQFTAPAYAPDGRLLVRESGEADAIFEIRPDGKPRRISP